MTRNSLQRTERGRASTEVLHRVSRLLVIPQFGDSAAPITTDPLLPPSGDSEFGIGMNSGDVAGQACYRHLSTAPSVAERRFEPDGNVIAPMNPTSLTEGANGEPIALSTVRFDEADPSIVSERLYANATTESGQKIPRPEGTGYWLRTWTRLGRPAGRRVLVLFIGAIGMLYGFSHLLTPTSKDPNPQTLVNSGTSTSPNLDPISDQPLRVNRSEAVGSTSRAEADEELFRAPSLNTRPIQRTPVGVQTAERLDGNEQVDGSRSRAREQGRLPVAQVPTPTRLSDPTSPGPESLYEERLVREVRPGVVEDHQPAYPATNPQKYRDPMYDVPFMADRQNEAARR